MRNLAGLFALPASSIFALISPTVQCQDWPYDLPAGFKYYPEHEPLVKRNLEIQQRIASSSPQGMHKMSDDEGEKFFMEYWQFQESTSAPFEITKINEEVQSPNHRRGLIPTTCNVSDHSGGLLPPLLLHGDLQQPVYLPRIFGRSLFERGWNCPTGTSNCESIGQPDSCCATGETCISLSGSGDASVGCCPSGATCGGDVGSCNTAEGYTSCSAGGCCIPGYTCQGVGCVYASTATTTTTIPAVTVTTGVSWSTLIDSTTTETFVVSAGSQSASISTTTTTLVMTPSASAGLTTVTQTIILTPSSSLPSTTTTSLTTTTNLATTTSASTKSQGSFVCSSGFRTCPASLGGGCCPTDRECGSVSCPASSSTATAVPPVLPTSGSGSSAAATPSTTASTTLYSGCPTGFYMCSAYYLGGCCRVGRDCDTTSCPSSASTVVVTGSGLTIEAPSGASSAVVTGSCATGWLSCAASNGGGCCPSGYSCGESCTASISGQSNVGKEAPSEAVRARLGGWFLLVLGIVSGAAMVLL